MNARFPMARPACARCGSIAAASCRCPGDTSAASSAIRLRRSRSSTPARGARLQLRHARLRPALLLLPELGDVTGAARSAGGRAAARRVAAKRSSHQAVRLGGRIVVSTYNEPLITSEWAVAIFQEARARGSDDGLCLERQRDAAGARLHPASHRSLQGRSQELRRQTLPAARRTPGSDPRSRSGRFTRSASGWRSSRC